MPTNRRPNNQPVRRPKVAGLRKRQTYNEELVAEARSADSGPAENGEAAVERAAERGEAVVERAAESGEAVAERGEAAVEQAEPAEVNGAAAEPETSAEHGEAVTERLASSGAPAEPGEAAGAGSERGEAVAESREATAEPEAGGPARAAVREAGKSAPPWPLWVATAVLIGLAGWFGFEAYSARYTGAAANEAMVSAGATSEVSGQVSDAVEKLFSYDFNDTAKTEAASKELLTGAAVQRYEELFAVVKEQAPQQQLIVTTKVKERSVTRLQGDRAELLLFVDQHARRANAPGENAGPAQISVSAEKQGDAWKISQITLR